MKVDDFLVMVLVLKVGKVMLLMISDAEEVIAMMEFEPKMKILSDLNLT